jgi:hypothetical protein
MAPAGQSTATVDMQVGDYLVLEVRDPDSGGYTPKKPLFDANILQFGGFRYIPPAQKAVFNTFGRFIYTFVALQPGSSEVRVVATPPGENQPSLRKTLARARAVIHP